MTHAFCLEISKTESHNQFAWCMYNEKSYAKKVYIYIYIKAYINH